MRIALLAPIALPVPPCGYGGTELVVSLLAEGLVAHGHAVTLFASGDSRSAAEVRSQVPRALTGLGITARSDYLPLETRHARWALAQAGDFDLVHDHTKSQGVLAGASCPTPILTTVHNDFTPERRSLYTSHPRHRYVAISQAQRSRCPALNWQAVVYNGIDLEPAVLRPKEDYLLFLGRLCEAKGAHTAIAMAQALGLPLVLAGKIDPTDMEFYRSQLAAQIDGERIRFVGEVTGAAKWELLARARCLVFPIQWPEPFGLVMIEAMACGTPVVATRWGSVAEVVSHGVTGWIAEDFEGLLEGVTRASRMGGRVTRSWVAQRFSAQVMVERYLQVYERVLSEGSCEGLAGS